MVYQRDFLHLREDVIPCWYQLSFDLENVCILMKVHQDYVLKCPVMPSDNHLVKGLTEKFSFTDFQGDLKAGDFGFNKSFKRIGPQDDFIVFSTAVPVLEVQHMETCTYCQGHSTDMLFGGKCDVCQGTGKIKKMIPCWWCGGDKVNSFGEDCHKCAGMGKQLESHMDWDTLYAISASFTIFFQNMYFGYDREKITSCSFSQLLKVDTTTNKEMHGGSLDGIYGIPLVCWLFSFIEPTHVTEAEIAMKKTWQKIHGKFDDMDRINTWAEVREGGWLSISCPGDRTGLFPSTNWGIDLGKGCEFSCHNVDTPAQQLTLLAGLAALCDRVRKDIQS